jgi:ribosome-associated protein
MIQITPQITLDESEIRLEFMRSSGPGGQNVNKVSSAVELRFDAANSAALPEEVRARLLKLAKGQLTEQGELIIKAQRFRTQLANRNDALQRLTDLIRQATRRPAVRQPTRPTAASKERRLEIKRRRSGTKRLRGKITDIEGD